MNKSITIISLNYHPEDTAIGLYSTQMAEYLQKLGWNITVITGFPYYPKWEISKDYKNKKIFIEEDHNGIKILRYKQFVPKNPSFIKRIFHIIDFTLGSTFNTKKIKQTDIVLSVIPFTSSAWLGKNLAKRINAKHWIHIQDFEFDVALESGISSNNSLMKFLSKRLFNFERKLLDSADIVSTISYGMIEKLKKKSNSKTYYFPNWIDNDTIDPLKAKQHNYMSGDKFKILYSGNIGAKQDWSLFLRVTDYFKENDQIEFIIVGNGSNKHKLIEQTKGFKNVKHFDPVPLKELNNLLCSADLHLLFQKGDVVDTVMPSKVLGMMASEVPSLVTGNQNSEVAKLFKLYNLGYFYKSSDFRLVTKKIKNMIFKKEEGLEIGKHAREHVISSFSGKIILDNFEEKLRQINEIKN
ncbi:MAG: WcaI family glycosyltransferase [Bacteroidota bacterium]